jgi:hypothetical protein
VEVKVEHDKPEVCVRDRKLQPIIRQDAECEDSIRFLKVFNKVVKVWGDNLGYDKRE